MNILVEKYYVGLPEVRTSFSWSWMRRFDDDL